MTFFVYTVPLYVLLFFLFLLFSSKVLRQYCGLEKLSKRFPCKEEIDARDAASFEAVSGEIGEFGFDGLIRLKISGEKLIINLSRLFSIGFSGACIPFSALENLKALKSQKGNIITFSVDHLDVLLHDPSRQLTRLLRL